MSRKAYPTDVSDEEWAFVAPYLIFLREDATQSVYPLHELFDAVRWMIKAGCPWRPAQRPAALDSRAAAGRTLEESRLL